MELFIFRRDLRCYDNTGLIAALREGKVVPCFVYDTRQVGANAYKGAHSLQFMEESLGDLASELKELGGKLHFFSGKAEEVIGTLLRKHSIDRVHVNRDYTPFSKRRDAAIARVCKKEGVTFVQHNDLLIHEPEDIKTGSGGPYKVFTPFYRAANRLPVRKPQACKGAFASISCEKKQQLVDEKNEHIKGGREAGKKILRKLKAQEDYAEDRDYPALDSTTHLSAHLKFGTVSVREAYWAVHKTLGGASPLLRQFYWRDFFTHITWHFPHVFGKSFNAKYDSIKWVKDNKKFKAWCSGNTGYPLVDAGMRELNATGYMHNRVRMVVGNFLVKDLFIDWREGEKYFAQQLVDYDPSVNNGNWQWCAGTGCDAQPYFRIFNPWTQQKKFDAECEYIKKWIPELREYSAKEIHNHVKDPLEGYVEPMVDHSEARLATLANYKRALQ